MMSGKVEFVVLKNHSRGILSVKNHLHMLINQNMPPICDVSEIAKRFLSTFKNLLIFDGWFLTNKKDKE